MYANLLTYVLFRQVTIQFDAHDALGPRSVLSDSALYPQNADNDQEYEESGIAYHFPYCVRVHFIAKPAPERLQASHDEDATPAGDQFYSRLLHTPHNLAARLFQLLPSTICHIVLDADLAEASARFAVALMTRSGDPNKEILLEVQTRSDQVMQKVEVSQIG